MGKQMDVVRKPQMTHRIEIYAIAVNDTEINGKKIKAGDRVRLDDGSVKEMPLAREVCNLHHAKHDNSVDITYESKRVEYPVESVKNEAASKLESMTAAPVGVPGAVDEPQAESEKPQAAPKKKAGK